MKITCTRENLKNAVLTAERFTSRHITLPILAHILCQADERKISLIATNLEIGVEYTISGKVQKAGIVTIPAKSLAQLLSSLTDDSITLEAKQHHVALHTPTTDITLLSLNPSDFPTLPVIKQEYTIPLAVSQLAIAFQRVISSVATSDIKPELAGIFFSVNPESIVCAATDSFRLAEHIITTDVNSSSTIECIIPFRTAQEVLRTLPDDNHQEVRIVLGEHQVVFEWDEIRIVSRLIDGAYPPYRNIIPASYETTILVNRDELMRKIRLAAVFSTRLNDVTIRFSPTALEVATENAEAGSTTSRLSAKGRGASGSVAFNYRYLNDGLEAAGGEHVLMNLNGVSGPTLIQNPSDASFRYLLMPIRSV